MVEPVVLLQVEVLERRRLHVHLHVQLVLPEALGAVGEVPDVLLHLVDGKIGKMIDANHLIYTTNHTYDFTWKLVRGLSARPCTKLISIFHVFHVFHSTEPNNNKA